VVPRLRDDPLLARGRFPRPLDSGTRYGSRLSCPTTRGGGIALTRKNEYHFRAAGLGVASRWRGSLASALLQWAVMAKHVAGSRVFRVATRPLRYLPRGWSTLAICPHWTPRNVVRQASGALRHQPRLTVARSTDLCSWISSCILGEGWVSRPYASIRSPVRSPRFLPLVRYFMRMLHSGILGDQPRLTVARTTDLCSRISELALRLALISARSFVSPSLRSFVRSSRVGVGKPRPPPITCTCRICVVFLRRTRRPASEYGCTTLVIKIQQMRVWPHGHPCVGDGLWR